MKNKFALTAMMAMVAVPAMMPAAAVARHRTYHGHAIIGIAVAAGTALLERLRAVSAARCLAMRSAAASWAQLPAGSAVAC